jgi:peptidyl-tRNA hydrolase
MIATIASVAIDHGQAELALQVNPFDYLGRHSKATAYATEAEYNDAVVTACLEHEVEAIAITTISVSPAPKVSPLLLGLPA